MGKVVAEVKFKWWAKVLIPIWCIQKMLGHKKLWLPNCSFDVVKK